MIFSHGPVTKAFDYVDDFVKWCSRAAVVPWNHPQLVCNEEEFKQFQKLEHFDPSIPRWRDIPLIVRIKH